MNAMRTHIILVGILLVSVGLTALPGATAERLESYTLVGEDPEGDATHYWVTGVGDPSGLFTTARLDILGVEMGTTSDELHVKLNIGTTPAGTSGYMYRVVFMVGEDTYFTCWNTQWVGGQHEEENVLGCSRFGGGTQVGPGLKEDGVDVASVDGVSFVRWEVPRGSIGDPADGTDVTGIFAETWVRGVSACCAGSQTSSQYLWNMADRAPDEGVADYVLGGGPVAVELNLTASPAERSVGPGSVVPITLETTMAGGQEANVTYSVEGLPEGWQARFSPEAAGLNSTANQTTSSLQILVDPSAENGTYPLTVVATAPAANASASANVTITIDRSLQASGPDGEEPLFEPTPTPDEDGNGTTPGNGTTLEEEGGGVLPAPGFMIGALLVGAVAAASRHRRNLQKP